MNARTLLITGANGFVGRALVEAAAARGWRVRAATRDEQPVAMAEANFRVGDLHAHTDWSRALSGCQAVVHLAARVHVMAQRDGNAAALFHATNVGASEHLGRMAVAAGVRRFIFISTVKVLGERSGQRPLRDVDPPAPKDAYAVSKLDAERVLFDLASRTGLEVTVLRPPLVYGPGVKANFLAMMTRIAQGWPLPLAALHSRRTFCYLGNLNDAILTALERPEAVGKAFLVGDGETLALPAFARRLGLALGRPARLLPVPTGLLNLAGLLLGRAAQVRRLTDSLELDCSGIETALGWHPPWSIDAGLAETARWYRSRHGR